MTLRETLQKMVDEGNPAKLSYGQKITVANELLSTLSEPMLNRKAHLQPGLYIAEINEGGYLGQVLVKFENSH